MFLNVFPVGRVPPADVPVLHAQVGPRGAAQAGGAAGGARDTQAPQEQTRPGELPRREDTRGEILQVYILLML